MAANKPTSLIKTIAARAPGPLRYPTKEAVRAEKAQKRARGSGGIVATIEDDVIVLRLPLIPKANRKPSSTGKSVLCASTRGPRKVHQVVSGDELVLYEIDGKPLKIIASAFIAAEAPVPKNP